jgi:hypothetical protein
MSRKQSFNFVIYFYKTVKARTGGVAPVVQHLLSKCEALSSNTSTIKKKKKKKVKAINPGI